MILFPTFFIIKLNPFYYFVFLYPKKMTPGWSCQSGAFAGRGVIPTT